MNEDMSQFLGVFLDEAREQIVLLEEDILKLEQSPSESLLQEIFRAAHTLKGSSRTMGFVPMGELTHAMEDVFDQLRHSKLGVSGALINALFAALDSLKSMIEDIADGGNTTRDTSGETVRLRAVLEGGGEEETKIQGTGTAFQQATNNKYQTTDGGEALSSSQNCTPAGFELRLSEAASEAAAEARGMGSTVYGLKLEVASDCIMKSVRALMTLQALDRIGTVLASLPDEDGLENEAFDTTFEVALTSEASVDEITATAHSVNEIRCTLLAPWEGPPTSGPDAKRGSAGAHGMTTAQGMTTAPDVATAASAGAPADSPACTPAPVSSPSDAVVTSEAPAAAVTKAAQTPAAQSKTENQKSKAPNATVRVDVARLDKLLDLVGELVIDRTRIARIGLKFEQQYSGSVLLESLNETSVHIGRITDELQDEIMKARMLPLESVFSRFPRMIRDLAQKLGKEVQFEVEGQETELDRSVIELIGDPLIHMLRNSIDHGIEMPDERARAGKPRAGTIHLRASHQENSIVIEIAEDGRGIDPDRLKRIAVSKCLLTEEAAQRLSRKEAINLIFAPGFSTAAALTDISGRGVGMDIVRSSLQKLGAVIDIDTRIGKGTTFRVRLPLTLAIIRGLLVDVAGSVYALPLNAVTETLKVDADTIHVIAHREVILQRGRTLPLVRLRDVFAPPVKADGRRQAGEPTAYAAAHDQTANAERAEANSTDKAQDLRLTSPRMQSDSLYVVVAGMAEKQVGFVVDALVGEQEVVIKTLGAFIGEIKGIAGATILGDGRVALIADINGLTAIAAGEKGKAHAA